MSDWAFKKDALGNGVFAVYVLYNWKDEKGEKISRQKNDDLFDFMV